LLKISYCFSLADYLDIIRYINCLTKRFDSFRH